MKAEKRKIRPFDIILTVSALIIALILFLVTKNAGNGTTAEIIIDGKTDKTINLENAEDNLLDYGDFKIEIKDGTVGFVYSDCFGQDCVNTGFISKAGETAVCLPNRALIKINGDKGDFPDAVSY